MARIARIRQTRWGLLVGVLLVALACMAGCGPEATPLPGSGAGEGAGSGKHPPSVRARAGEWSGSTGFGTFAFKVCDGGRKIEDYTLAYEVGGVSGTLELAEGLEGVWMESDGSFYLSEPEQGVVFSGRFSDDGMRASGVWEIQVAGGDLVSEEWAVER